MTSEQETEGKQMVELPTDWWHDTDGVEVAESLRDVQAAYGAVVS